MKTLEEPKCDQFFQKKENIYFLKPCKERLLIYSLSSVSYMYIWFGSDFEPTEFTFKIPKQGKEYYSIIKQNETLFPDREKDLNSMYLLSGYHRQTTINWPTILFRHIIFFLPKVDTPWENTNNF